MATAPASSKPKDRIPKPFLVSLTGLNLTFFSRDRFDGSLRLAKTFSRFLEKREISQAQIRKASQRKDPVSRSPVAVVLANEVPFPLFCFWWLAPRRRFFCQPFGY